MYKDAGHNVKSATSWLARTALLLAFTVAIQMPGLPQPVTGPAVNAMLLLAAGVVSPASGVLVGVFTPIIALYRGILPPPLAPMPFIGLGNAVFVMVFAWLHRRWGFVGVLIAAVAKFAVLSTAVRFMVSLPEAVAYAMGGAAAGHGDGWRNDSRGRPPSAAEAPELLVAGDGRPALHNVVGFGSIWDGTADPDSVSGRQSVICPCACRCRSQGLHGIRGAVRDDEVPGE